MRIQDGERTLNVLKADVADGVLHLVPKGSVDLVVTSPPYKKKDGWSLELMEKLGELVGHALRPGGRLFLNFGQLREGFARPMDSRALVYEGAHPALEPGQTIAWVKSVALPSWRGCALEILGRSIPPGVFPWAEDRLKELKVWVGGPGKILQRGHYQPITLKSPTLNYCWEPVFTFFKPPERMTNRLSIGCPFADKTNLKRGTRGKHGDLHCAGDVWFIPHSTTGVKKKKAHGHQFPEELVERCVKVSGIPPGSTVMDPFSGSGTTVRVAKRLGMDGVAVDVSREAIRTTVSSWAQEGHDAKVGVVKDSGDYVVKT